MKETRVVQHLVIRPLRGMGQRWVEPPSRAARVRDMRWNPRDGWQDSGGYRELTNDYDQGEGPINSYANESQVTSMTWFAQHNGSVQWLIYTTASGRWCYFNGSGAPVTNHTDIYYIDGTQFDGSARSITFVDGPNPGPQYQVFGNRLYMVNGLDEPLCFDGIKARRAGFANAPKAPDAMAANRIPTDTTWMLNAKIKGLGYETGDQTLTNAYRYRQSFLNEHGQESPLSENSGLVTWESGASVKAPIAVTLSTGGPEVVARRIYRTQNLMDTSGDPYTPGVGGAFFFLAEVQDNVSTIYMDVAPDAGLGAAVDDLDFGPWPAQAALIAAFKDTMFLATTGDSRLYFSAPWMPENFPPDNLFDLGNDKAGPITALCSTKNALVVFKGRGIYLVRGDPESGFTADTLTLDEGCDAPNAILEIPGLGIVYVGAGEIRLLDGALANTGTPTKTVPLSATILDEMERVNWAAVCTARAAIYHRDHEAWFILPTLGKHLPDLALIYHYDIGEWSLREHFPVGGLVETGDHRGYLIFGSWDVANVPGVYVYSPGWTNKGGVWDIEPLYETAHMDFGRAWEISRPLRLGVVVVGYGTNDVQVNFVINRGMVNAYGPTRAEDHTALHLGHDQLYPTDDAAVDPENPGQASFPLYGAVVWGAGPTVATAKWANHRPVTIEWDIGSQHMEPVSELQMSIRPAGRRIQLCALQISIDGERSNVRVLSDNWGGTP